MKTLQDVKKAYGAAKNDAERKRINDHVMQHAPEKFKARFLVCLAVRTIDLH